MTPTSVPFLDLKAQQVNFLLGFNVQQDATITLLRAVVESKTLLLHFSAVPPWVTHMPPLKSGRSRDAGHEAEILRLVLSSIPLGFTPEAMAGLNRQLGQL